MDWTQALTIIGINVALFMYLSTRMENLRSDIKSDMRDFKSDTNQRLAVIENENKEIGKRLATIEGYLTPRKVVQLEASHSSQSVEDETKEN